MKKFLFITGVTLAVLFLVGCNNENKEKISGIWQLQIMNINGTSISGKSLGNWLWEFNDEGGYLINVGGEIEKGTYSLKEMKLTMKSVTHKERPEQIYSVTNLDSVSLSLVSAPNKNKTSLSFIKINSEKVGEKD